MSKDNNNQPSKAHLVGKCGNAKNKSDKFYTILIDYLLHSWKFLLDSTLVNVIK